MIKRSENQISKAKDVDFRLQLLNTTAEAREARRLISPHRNGTWFSSRDFLQSAETLFVMWFYFDLIHKQLYPHLNLVR